MKEPVTKTSCWFAVRVFNTRQYVCSRRNIPVLFDSRDAAWKFIRKCEHLADWFPLEVTLKGGRNGAKSK